MLEAIRAKGYAVQDREINPRTTGIAVPIALKARVLGCLSLIWIPSALTIDQAEIEFLPLLRSTASRIVNAVRDRTLAGPIVPKSVNSQCTKVCGTRRTISGQQNRNDQRGKVRDN
jgi:hypothetical protein